MATEGRRTTVVPILLSAAVLLWPALWNGYPLVFADTGTYLSQAIEHYLGWDRPAFYSLFLLPLHMTLTTWPAIAVQALLVTHTLHLVRRALLPGFSDWWLLPGVGFLSIATALPWFASQLVPDIFTSLLVLVLALLVLVPERLSRREHVWLIMFSAFMIAAHQSHVPLALGLLLVLLLFRRRLGAATPLGRRGVLIALAPPVLAMAAMVAVNVAGFGRVALSPFGNVFLLARVIYDGPGMNVLHRECPRAGWRLCAFVDQMPATSDDFLWRDDGPMAKSGGAKQVSKEADAIISAALRAEPSVELRAFLTNGLHQLTRFASGDGLEPWPTTVTPWMVRDFPRREVTAYAAARQTMGTLAVPTWMQTLHQAIAILGVIVCCALLPTALRRRHVVAGFIVAVLLALLGNAAITGGLSTPHDRYQSRIMWLPPLMALLATLALLIRDRQAVRPIYFPRHAGAMRTPGLALLRAAKSWMPNFVGMTSDNKKRHANNVFWSGFEAAISATLSFASAFIIARLIGPSEVGIAAAVVAVHVLLWVAVNALFADPLVQRVAVDDAAFSSAFWASAAIGGAAALLQLALAQPIAWWLGDNRLVTMSVLLALPLPLVGAAGPIQGLLTRNRAYKALAGRTLIGQGLGTVIGIAAALMGAGAWAIVLQQLVFSSAGAVALLVRCPTRLRCMVNWRDLRDMLRIGLPLTASTLVQHGRYRVFALLIGGTAGATALGQVHMAFRLVDTVRELAFTAQWRLMLPLLSERQNDLPALHARVDRCLAWSSLLAFPLCSAMALSIQPVVRLLLGPVWQPSGVAALPLIGLTAWLFLAFPAGVAVIARGRPRYTLIANMAGLAATVAGAMLLRPASPLGAVLVWLGAQLFISPYIMFANARVLRTGWLRPVRTGLPMLGAMLLATLATFLVSRAVGRFESPVLLIAVRLLIAAGIGVPVALLLTVGTGLMRSLTGGVMHRSWAMVPWR
ncbi:MAG TPA: oligosaccharide flippase family protein [Acetobacteraceae bacterium]|nr:oligosaccharide flippase family protein [Acetobacteraceae bacterium]